jgi:hypothetical protein
MSNFLDYTVTKAESWPSRYNPGKKLQAHAMDLKVIIKPRKVAFAKVAGQNHTDHIVDKHGLIH